MLTPEQLQNLPKELTDLYSQLTEFILRDIARRIAKGAKITDTAEYQLYRARSLGLSEKEIAAKIAEINGVSVDVIDTLIRDAAAQSDEFDRRMLGADDGAAVPLEDNKQLQKLMAAQIKETAGDCENLTGTMGFADHDFLGRVYYLSMTDMYRRELDSAHMKVVTGATDYMTAIRQACNKLAASGVRTIDYESGRSDRVEVAVRRALLTSVGHITHRISEENGKEFGADGWEMSAHSGARPSHAVYQGRQYTQAEYEKKIKSLLSEPNCRHDVFPIILGVSEPTYTEEELRNIDSPPFTYEGRKYTAYEASQQMRKMERAMRKQKDRCIVADAAGDEENFTAASIKLRRQKDIYEDFCKAADSYTQYERTFVAGYDRRLAGKTGAVTRKQREFDKAQMRLTDSGNGGIINSERAKKVERHRPNWQKASLEATKKKLLGDAATELPVTDTGKIYYVSDSSPYQVVYDSVYDYFRIIDTRISGKRHYVDINGNNVANYTDSNNKQHGRSKSEYQEITHFDNTDKKKGD
ncbi:MAG: phage minor capsid protein [Oscillospiraceae bacterium]|nr:phage minor capsid protein [Oscillospiraceae bacterium]